MPEFLSGSFCIPEVALLDPAFSIPHEPSYCKSVVQFQIFWQVGLPAIFPISKATSDNKYLYCFFPQESLLSTLPSYIRFALSLHAFWFIMSFICVLSATIHSPGTFPKARCDVSARMLHSVQNRRNRSRTPLNVEYHNEDIRV